MPEISKSTLLTGTSLHIDDTGGPGRPVVLIHGWPLSGEAWQDQVPALVAAGHRVVTYDRRGFGQSEARGPYDYGTLAKDLHTILAELDLDDVTLVGFSMGGGEVARYITDYGEERLHSVVFAAAVTPYLLLSADNLDGPLTENSAHRMKDGIESDRDAFFDKFTTDFFSVDEQLKVTEVQRQEAIRLCLQSDQTAALGCMNSFGTTDFREDLLKISVPTLVIHGDGDGIVPFEGSGARTHAAIGDSELVLLADAPHGLNISHREQFNAALLNFLAR